ncbi:hypothetical protein [Streptomyces sp. NPDC001137]|uniref:hypothetical protein n=1 Tax=Streptomyces sp. NPDC001137 TaxID=3154378 RepID=UPI0033304EFF
MGLARAELERHDWDAIQCGCGRSARHLLDTLETILAGGAFGAVRSLDDHVLIQSVLMPPAPAVCAVVMAHLADGMAVAQEQEILWLLLALVAGEVDGDSVEDSLQMRCVETVRDGLWLVYRAYLDASGPVAKGYADDVLDIVEWDPVRLEHYRAR